LRYPPYPDPSAFKPESIDAATLAFNQQVEELLSKAPSVHTLPVEQTRAARREGRGTFGPIVRIDEGRDIEVAGPAGPITIRTFMPRTVNALFVHLHGGGWVLGGADMQDQALWSLAQAANVAVASIEYRLAPECPFPAGPDDCEAAALWLIRNAKAEFGAERLLIGGESAGAHLAVLTLLRLRDRHAFNGFAAAALTYGVYDLAGTPSVRRWGDRNLILSGPIMEWFFDRFLCECEDDRRDPGISPLYADLSGMPRALFTVGTLDPLLDDSLLMHARWLAAGNEAQLAVYPGGIHAFNVFPIPIAQQANERIQAFLASAAAGD
jgi:acetyl esterase